MPVICVLGGVPLGGWLGSLRGSVEPSSGGAVVGVEMLSPTARKVAGEPSRPILESVLAASGREQFRLIASFLPEASKEEIRALLSIPKSERDSWRLLLARWCELAPQESLAWVREDETLKGLEGWCFYAWSQVDPLAAMAAAEKEPGKHLSQVVDALIAYDVQLALALSECYPERISLRNQVLAAWCKDDPEAAMAYAQGLPEKERLSALAALMGTMAREDSDQALSVALCLVDEKQREKALFALLPEAIKSDPDTAEKHILTLPEGKPRYELMWTLAKERAERDPVAAMAWAKGQDDPGVRRAGIMAAFKAMSFDSINERIEWLQAVGLEEALPNLREGTSTQREDGSGAGLSGGGDLRHTLIGVVRDLSAVDPREALSVIAGVPPQEGNMDFHPRDSLFRELGKGWLQGEHREIFVAGLAEIPLESARAQVVRGAMDDASSETLAWLATQDALFDSAVGGTAVIEQLAREWVKVDSMAASEWIGNLDASSGKDRAIYSLVRSLVEGRRPDFEAAFAW